MKKVIIVGAGISGMTAGIILQNSGFETEIYEKNPIAGGELTGWKRDGVYIDNCINYLMCSGYLHPTSTLKTAGCLCPRQGFS